MLKLHKRILSIGLAALLLLPVAGLAADVAGSADHPQVKRVQGANIYFRSAADFDQLMLALGKVEWSGAEGKVKDFPSVTAEGKRLTNYYRLPGGIGVLEALRNYEQDLREAGFKVMFSGRGEAVETTGYNNQIAREVYGMRGTYGSAEEKAQWPFQETDESQAAYLSAKKSSEGGELYVSVYLVANKHDQWLTLPLGVTLARVDVIDVRAREQRMELVSAKEMASSILQDGRVALYGIEFDFDSASLRAESKPTLAEIARLLKEQPKLSLLVVGHTDSAGSFEYNRKLSQQRAESVVADLTARGVLAGRLFPVGVGFAAPVAANGSEEGRAKNRRVELVDMAGGRFK